MTPTQHKRGRRRGAQSQTGAETKTAESKRAEKERKNAEKHAARSRVEIEDPDQPGLPDADLSPQDSFDRAVPRPVQVAAAWSWRILAIGAAVAGIGWSLRYLSELTVPLAVAVLLTAMLYPVTKLLLKTGMPHGAAVAISIVGGLLVVAGAISGITAVIAGGYEELADRSLGGIQQLIGWLNSGPIPIDQGQINDQLDNLKTWLLDSKSTIAGYAATVGSSIGHFFAGLALMLFSLIYFLYNGRQIWTFMLKFLPSAARQRADIAAKHGWHSLVSYVRATVLVAAVDALGTLIGALILGVPLAPALAALVFLGAFIPLVGAFVSGTIAVAVALLALGPIKAAIMLGVIVGVMFIEGHFLQPFLLGRAVRLHPLAVLLGIAAGLIIGGIVGGLFAIPILAFGKTFVQSLATGDGSLPGHQEHSSQP